MMEPNSKQRARVFKHSLNDQEKPQVPMGHPVHNFLAENRAAENIRIEIQNKMQSLKQPPTVKDIEKNREELAGLVDKLFEIDKHYLRKENQLFPRLEEKGMSGPSQVMWAIHDDIRQMIKTVSGQIETSDLRVFD